MTTHLYTLLRLNALSWAVWWDMIMTNGVMVAQQVREAEMLGRQQNGRSRFDSSLVYAPPCRVYQLGEYRR